jgi:hypothetical protein
VTVDTASRPVESSETLSRRVPGVRAPWIAGVAFFLLLAIAAGIFLARPRAHSPVPQSLLDARRESTVAAAQAVARSLNGGVSSLAEIAAVVDESMRQRGKPLLAPFTHRRWRSLYVVDRTSRLVVAQVGEAAQPAVLGATMPTAAGIRWAQVGTSNQIVQFTPVGKPDEARYLLVGHLDPTRLTDLLAAAGHSAWLVDNTGSVIAGTGTPPSRSAEPAKESAENSSGSRVEDGAGPRVVTAWSSLVGKAPSGALGWTVLSSQDTTEAAAPADDYTGRAILLSTTLGALTIVVFAGLHFMLIRPVRQLRQAGARDAWPRIGEAGRIARALRQSTDRPPRYVPTALIAWTTGGMAFLAFAGIMVPAPASWLTEQIPQSVPAEQQARTALAARQLQQSLDSGVGDLATVAAGIRSLPDADSAGRLLAAVLSTRNRYRGVVYLTPTGEVQARAGEEIDVGAIPPADKPALAAAATQGVSPRVLVSVPLSGKRAGRLVAEFKPNVLIRPLSLAGPGDTRLVNSHRQVIGATTRFTAFERLSRPDLDRAGQSALASGTGSAIQPAEGRRHVLSWAPVTSTHLGQQLGLAVVTDRTDTALTLPHSTERRELLLFAVLIVAGTIVIFGCLYVLIVGPLSALARSAGRLSRGETGEPVIVRRYDHIGLIARDLERVRRGLRQRS